jgi:hypothetical protein
MRGRVGTSLFIPPALLKATCILIFLSTFIFHSSSNFRFVTPGSYVIVQDTKITRWEQTIRQQCIDEPNSAYCLKAGPLHAVKVRGRIFFLFFFSF